MAGEAGALMRGFQQVRLRTRIVTGVFAGLAVLFSVFGLLTFQTIGLSSDIALESRLRLATISAESVDELLDHTARQLERMATVLAPETAVEQQSQAAQIYDLLHEFGRIVRLGPAGDELWAVPRQTDDFRWAFSDDAAVKAALRSFETRIVAPARGVVAEDLVAILITPLDASDPSAGFLAGELRASHADVSLFVLPRGEPSIRSEIVDADGYIVVRSGEEDEPLDEHVEILAPMIADGKPGTTIHRVEDGPDHVVAYAPFRLRPGGLVVEETEDAALAIPREMQQTLIVYGIAALLAASVAAWIHAGSVVRPIRDLTGDAARMASGDLLTPIAVSREDEIGELARRFDEMRVRLRTSLEESARWAGELEHRVLERTLDVEERNRQLSTLNRTRRQLLAKTISAQEEERKRLARELHDNSAQTLAAVMMTLKTAEDAVRTAPGVYQKALGEARGQLEMALGEIRRAIIDLRPSALDDLGLASAVRTFADEHLRPLGIRVTMQTSGDDRRATGAAATAIFRILQEAITNVARHSGAEEARVDLEFGAESMLATVKDEGRGFDPNELRQPLESGRGLGLLGMRERADLFGGEVEIKSHPGRGTSVRARMPYG